jgi:hypothetical protein
MKETVKLFMLIATIFVASSFSSSKAIQKWTKLGSKKVSFQLDRDVIRVGANDGRFTELKVQVTGGALNMHKMVIEYGNGTKDNIPLKQNFKNNGTRVIDLQGNKRVIKDITFYYDTKNKSRRRAIVHVYGRR